LVALLGILVWLAGRYESSMVQSRLEHDASEAVTDIRSGLTRNIQTFQALQSSERTPFVLACVRRRAASRAPRNHAARMAQ
jgi:two-component system sensor histidine kinase DctS